MRIQHNIAALNSHRQLTANNSSVSKNLEKLSSGYRINRAGDDAAGLAISEKMRAQITGLNTASKNAQDGVSLVQTAEGALTEVHSMLNRMAELADQSANGTYQDAVDRENIQKELTSLRSEIDRISEGTNFNGIKLLDGSMGGGGTGATAMLNGTEITVKATAGVKVEFKLAGATSSVDTTTTPGTVIVNLDSTQAGSLSAEEVNKMLKDAGINDITVSFDKKLSFSAGTAATTNAMTSAKSKNATLDSGGIKFESTTGGDVKTKVEVKVAAGGAERASIAANGDVILELDSDRDYTADDITSLLNAGGVKGIKATNVDNTNLASAAASAMSGGAGAKGAGLRLQIGESSDTFNQLTVSVASMSTSSLGIDSINVSTQDGAKAAIDNIKNAINKVSSTRGDLGAIQNRLEHTVNNLGVTAENMSAAESRIRDVDMAQEMMNFTKNNILTQASQAMLAQANQLPQGVLQLLQ